MVYIHTTEYLGTKDDFRHEGPHAAFHFYKMSLTDAGIINVLSPAIGAIWGGMYLKERGRWGCALEGST